MWRRRVRDRIFVFSRRMDHLYKAPSSVLRSAVGVPGVIPAYKPREPPEPATEVGGVLRKECLPLCCSEIEPLPLAVNAATAINTQTLVSI